MPTVDRALRLPASAGGLEINFATTFETVAARLPDRPAIVRGVAEIRYAELADRIRRLARFLHEHGIGLHRQRADLAGHETGQDLVAQYLFNCPEYLEGLLGSYRARAAPFNVNYRYVAEELRYLLRDAKPRVIQYHASFAAQVAEAQSALPDGTLLLQVDDGSGTPLLPGAIDYEQALAAVPAEINTEPSPDDLYVLYTGGTTGMPKGVLWRQADAAVVLTGQLNRRTGTEWADTAQRLSALPTRPRRILPLAPFMHGASQWAALQTICEGNTLVIPADTRTLDAAHIWETVQTHQVSALSIVGDAFARPLTDEIERQPRSVDSLRVLLSGGARMAPDYKRRLTKAVPGLQIIESMGSSETGVLGRSAESQPADGRALFHPEPGTLVISEDMTSVLGPGHPGIGWLAASRRVPLGYLGDPDKTAQTFPVVGGVRVSLPGDRARLHADGRVELLGRDSMTINTGGEKVFAEEVENAVKEHPDVIDAVVCGRPSPRWGSEVVALVQFRDGSAVDSTSLIAYVATKLARYKLPKVVLAVDRVERGPAGKADYRWAIAAAGSGETS